MNEPELIRKMLAEPTSIAVVGLSDNPAKASHYVSLYMQQQGFTIYPINPAIGEVLGRSSFSSLTELTAAGIKPALVNVFRTPNFIPAVVDEMLALKLDAVWVQQGIVHHEAAIAAEAGGIGVVMDRCIMVEHRRLYNR